MKPKWPTPFPGANWLDRAEERAVLAVLRRGALFRYYGPRPPTAVARLEARARAFYGSKYALAVSSGTGALAASMTALGIGPGMEVIVPAFLWVATVSAVVHAGAIPVLAEVDDSFTLDPQDLARKITPRTRLILPVHMAGAPADMKAVMAAARRRGVPVLEDCAQCNGGSFRGRKVGTFGDIGIFSFQINKNITAGEGGLAVTDREDLFVRLQAAHDVGVPWKGGGPDSSGAVRTWGQGRRMGELAGAVAEVQLRKLPRIVRRMRRSNERVRAALEGLPHLRPRRLTDPEGDTGPFLILIFDEEARARRAAENLRAAGVPNSCRLADYGLHIYSNIAALVEKAPLSPAGNPWSLRENAGLVRQYRRGACPRSDDLFDRSVLVTVPSRLSRPQERAMAAAVRGAVSTA
jgi:8-amino-3,8-dideoxy-alpha-D-manno-octulosonate transaminase